MHLHKFLERYLLLFICCIASNAIAQSLTNFEGVEGNQNRTGVNLDRQSSHWTLSVEAIALTRGSNTDQKLVNQIGGAETFLNTINPNRSMPLLNSNQLRYGYGVGPKITLSFHDSSDYVYEAVYFNALNINASQTVGANGNWLTMYAPGFWQTQDYANQGMSWTSTTGLNSAEASAKQKLSQDFSWITGLRWIRLKDSLTGSVTPPDIYFPAWKFGASPVLSCGSAPPGGNPTFQGIMDCGNVQSSTPKYFSNFWSANVLNDLLGVQVGGQGVFLRIGQLSLEGSLKVGLYNNYSSQNTSVSLAKTMYIASASSSQLAYSGDGLIQLKYQIAQDIKLKLGYQVLWINQIALAAGQVSRSSSSQTPAGLTANGVNANSSILFQGGTIGLEYVF